METAMERIKRERGLSDELPESEAQRAPTKPPRVAKQPAKTEPSKENE